MTVYNLSDSGKEITWGAWKKYKGCGLSHMAYGEVAPKLGPEGSWRSGVTLGDIAAHSKLAERELARFAIGKWPQDDYVTVEYP